MISLGRKSDRDDDSRPQDGIIQEDGVAKDQHGREMTLRAEHNKAEDYWHIVQVATKDGTVSENILYMRFDTEAEAQREISRRLTGNEPSPTATECKATVLWLSKGLEPAQGLIPTSRAEGRMLNTLTEAVAYWTSERLSRAAGGYLGWLKPHASGGARWIDEAGIEALARTFAAKGLY